jgi:hypothetical protein
MPGEINPSNVLSKHWGHVDLWPRVKTLLFGMGDTANLFIEKAPPEKKGEFLDKKALPEEEGARLNSVQQAVPHGSWP